MDELLFIAPESMVASRTVELLGSDYRIYGAGMLDVPLPGQHLADYYKLDITDLDQAVECLKRFPGQYFVNFAAATAVDDIEKSRPQRPDSQAELNTNLAYRINVLGTRNLVEAAKQTGKKPFLISTDYVFKGVKGPLDEDEPLPDSPEGLTWYGWTKNLAEKEVLAAGIDFLMLRISFPYRREFEGKGDIARNFIKMYDKYKAGEIAEIYPIFDDQILTPTFVDDVGPALKLLISQQQVGTFHLASPEAVSMYDFVCEIFKVARGVENPESLVLRGSLVDYMKEHPGYIRHLDSSLNSGKIRKLGMMPTSWRDGLKQAYGQR